MKKYIISGLLVLTVLFGSVGLASSVQAKSSSFKISAPKFSAPKLKIASPKISVPIVKVNGYTKKDNTKVPTHFRTAPNNTKSDNWSTKGNVNPITGKKGTKK